jgi:hypothetical protein
LFARVGILTTGENCSFCISLSFLLTFLVFISVPEESGAQTDPALSAPIRVHPWLKSFFLVFYRGSEGIGY